MNFGNDLTLTRLDTEMQPEKAEIFTQFRREPINSAGQKEKEMRTRRVASVFTAPDSGKLISIR